MRRVAMVLLLVTVLSGCWLQDGWDGSRSGFAVDEHTLTTANVATLTRAWGATNAAAATSPVVVGGTVYTTAGSVATAYDAVTGTVRWQRTVALNEIPATLSSLSAGYPVADHGLTASANALPFAAPVTFDAATGDFTVTPAFHTIYGSAPVYAAGIEAIIVSGYGSNSPPVAVLNYGGHRALLSCCGSPDALSGPTIVAGRVLVTVGTRVEAYPLAECLPGPAEGLCAPEWSTELGGPGSVPVGVGPDRVAVARADGTVAVLDAATGAIQFAGATGSASATPPAVADGVLFTGTADGRLVAFPAEGCGAAVCPPSWSGSVGSVGPVGSVAAISRQPVAAADVVYVGTADGRVVAFPRHGCGAATCAPLWTGVVADGSPGAVTGLAVAGGAVFATTDSGAVAAFRLP